MIPGSFLFSHLFCGFGSKCDRPYCSYSHPVEDDEDRPVHKAPEQTPAAGDEYEIQIIQHGLGANYYEGFAYRGYIEEQQPMDDKSYPNKVVMDNYVQVEGRDVGQYKPGRAERESKPIQTEKRKHHGYSVLNDKPSIPVDLANDDILANLSAAQKQGKQQLKTTTKQPAAKKQRAEIPSTTTIKLRPGLQNGKRYDITPPQTRCSNTKNKNQSIDKKMTMATNSFIAQLREENNTANKQMNRAGEIIFDSSAKYQPVKSMLKRSSDPVKAYPNPGNSTTLARCEPSKHIDQFLLEEESTVNAYAQFNGDKNTLRSTSAFDAEREMHEIELLERKNKLLRENRRLAMEISEIESKRASCSKPEFVNSPFEDDEPGTPREEDPPSKIRRIAHKSEKPPESRNQPPKGVPVKPLESAALATNDRISKNVIGASANPMLPAFKASGPTPRNHFHEQMVKRLPVGSPPRSSSSLTKWNLNNSSSKEQSQKKSALMVGAETNRTAHTPRAPLLNLLDRYSTKIPFKQRQSSLQKLYEELGKHDEISPEKAAEMAQKEEILLLDRCQSTTGYASSLAGIIRGIRNKQFTLPTPNMQDTPTTSITETMQKERRMSRRGLTEDQFYQILSDKYVLTTEKLRENGYPYVMRCEDGQKRVKIDVADEKTLFTEDNDFRRVCCRCGAEFQLNSDGTFVKQQDCVFHWKRPFKKRINRTMETRYGCCDSDLSVKGCSIEPHHVHRTMRRRSLQEFIRTPPPSSPGDPRSRKVYAMDAEMVHTIWGMSIARLTVVDWNDDLVLDLLIKPDDEVLDYNTKFSGLTCDMLRDAKYTLATARRKLIEYVCADTILIGHSLESDLCALRLVHRRVVDTSIVFPHRLGPPQKRALRSLASDHLHKIIQEDVEGHCSKEDSSVCMQLMLLRARGDIS